MFLIVPFGLFHIDFRPNSFTRASSVNHNTSISSNIYYQVEHYHAAIQSLQLLIKQYILYSKFHREGTLPCCPILITTMPNISFVPPLHALPAFIQVNLPDIWTMTHLIKQPMLIDSGGAHQGEPEQSIN